MRIRFLFEALEDRLKRRNQRLKIILFLGLYITDCSES